MRKGVSPLISFVLYTAIAVMTISIVITVGFPYLEKIRDSVAIKQAQDFLSVFDSVVSEVALSGQNSKVPITLRFDRGKYSFSEEQNELRFRIKTKSNIISQGASARIGPLSLEANENETYVILKYNTTELVLAGYNKILFPGTHKLVVQNMGVKNNQLIIEVNSWEKRDNIF